MPMPPRKKKADFALLLGEEPEEKAVDPLLEDDEDMDDLGDDDLLEDEDLPEDDAMSLDPLADDMPSIDPEQAALAETLGFTEPDQQQALIDLIKLVTSADPMATESSTLPPLPESTY